MGTIAATLNALDAFLELLDGERVRNMCIIVLERTRGQVEKYFELGFVGAAVS